MGGRIYLIQDNGQLVDMTEQAYDSEDLLQELLAKYPSLLAGDQIDRAAPRRWLLISREKTLPSQEEGAGRWAVDHLFLDQDAIPTLVEVKRSSDTRIRREVVGQVLDYAANAVLFWPIEEIQAQFKANCEAQNLNPQQVLSEFLSPDADQEQFWQKTKTNLLAGRIRMIFVADEIPDELRRIIEFLGKQMDPAEVLAVEIKQYVGRGLKTLVPRVIGQMPPPPPPQWDEKRFFQTLAEKRGTEETRVARQILQWVNNKMSISYGKGRQYGSLIPVLEHRGTAYVPFMIWTNGYVQTQFGSMQTRPPFNDESKRLELLSRLNAIPGVDIPDDAITRFPSIRLSTLKDEAVLKQFLEVLDWCVQEIKAS